MIEVNAGRGACCLPLRTLRCAFCDSTWVWERFHVLCWGGPWNSHKPLPRNPAKAVLLVLIVIIGLRDYSCQPGSDAFTWGRLQK
jgi:hypothetical protein